MRRSIGNMAMTCALACSSALAVAQAAAPAIPDSIYAPLRMEEGTWDAEVTFYENDKPSGHAKGVQINTFLANRHWMVNEFRIPGDGKFPPYEGHGTWGYDPVAKTYVNTWIDTNDLAVRTDYGFWYDDEKTMVWSTKQNDGNGHFVDYRSTEEFKGDTRIFTVSQLGLAKPNPHPLVKIVFTRRKGAPGAK